MNRILNLIDVIAKTECKFIKCYVECRAKYHKLKFGTEPNQEELKPPQFKDTPGAENAETQQNSKTGLNWRQGRQLLRQ